MRRGVAILSLAAALAFGAPVARAQAAEPVDFRANSRGRLIAARSIDAVAQSLRRADHGSAQMQKWADERGGTPVPEK